MGTEIPHFEVYISPQAEHDIDQIYSYIAEHLLVEPTAVEIVEEIEATILSLETFPLRGAVREIGKYAGQYRQALAKNYVIIYRVDETAHKVMVITVKHSLQDF